MVNLKATLILLGVLMMTLMLTTAPIFAGSVLAVKKSTWALCLTTPQRQSYLPTEHAAHRSLSHLIEMS